MWPKYGSFSFFSISPSNEYLELISFRMDWFDHPRDSRVFSNTTVPEHQFFDTPSSLWSNFHMTTGKTIALAIWTDIIASSCFHSILLILLILTPLSCGLINGPIFVPSCSCALTEGTTSSHLVAFLRIT